MAGQAIRENEMSKFLEWWIKLSGNEEAQLLYETDIFVNQHVNYACASIIEYGGVIILSHSDPFEEFDHRKNNQELVLYFPDFEALDNYFDKQLERMK